MPTEIYLNGLSLPEFYNELEKVISAIVKKELSQLIEQTKKDKYLTRKEVIKLLKISLPTLNDWTKRKLITAKKIGTRVLYKESDIEAALNNDISNNRGKKYKLK